MKKVTTINLSGNAYQLEEAGYELLKKYLDQAKKNLAEDPDKDEILTDFERAIAEKCDGHLGPRKNVVGEKEVQKIIDDMGPVEAANDTDKKEETTSEKQTKRLYTLADGAMIGGVANGLAAYLNIDVNIIRLLFVILVFATSGVWILIYLLMMLVLPEARTPEQKAELRGEKFSAQDVLGRAKQKYAEIGNKAHWHSVAEQGRPLFSGLGAVVVGIVRIAAFACGAFGSILLGLLTVAWLSTLSWLVFSHPHFADQLSTISHWTVGAAATAGYFLLALPLGVLVSLFVRIGLRRHLGKQGLQWLIGVSGLWLLALVILISIAFVAGGRVKDYQAAHGYVNVINRQICINSARCSSVMTCKGAEDCSFEIPSGPGYVCPLDQMCSWVPDKSGNGDYQRIVR